MKQFSAQCIVAQTLDTKIKYYIKLFQESANSSQARQRYWYVLTRCCTVVLLRNAEIK